MTNTGDAAGLPARRLATMGVLAGGAGLRQDRVPGRRCTGGRPTLRSRAGRHHAGADRRPAADPFVVITPVHPRSPGRSPQPAPIRLRRVVVKGGPEAHPAGTRSALRATGRSRHPDPTVERHRRPEMIRVGPPKVRPASAPSPQTVRNSAESGHYLPVAINDESAGQPPYSSASTITPTPANGSRRTGRLVRRPQPEPPA